MESLGEVGVLMNMGADNGGCEILKTLLSTSKPHKSEEVEVNVLQDVHNKNRTEDQLVLQIEVPEPIIQHIPITYLTAEPSDLTPVSSGAFVEPVTYVLSRNVLAENRYSSLGRNESQKIILFQGVDSNAGQSVYRNPEGKVFRVREREAGQCGYSELWDGERGVEGSCIASGTNCEVVIKGEEKGKEEKNKRRKVDGSGGTVRGRRGKLREGEKSGSNNTKVQRKISTGKKPLNKRKSSKLRSKLKGGGGKGLVKKPLKAAEEGKERQNLFELTKLEDNVDQVAERLQIGCECSDSNCFDGLKPEEVFKHRLNIADLTKAEHDMYLMGVIMASIHNLEETCRHKERIRIRSCYAYQGKKVCLTAFLYLQHVTVYQMKRLRSHLKNHGVSPRIHGNHGRKPANTLSLDIYRRATNFVQNYIEKHCVKTVPNFTTFSSNKIGSNSIVGTHEPKTNTKKETNIKIASKMTSYHLPPEYTKRRVHKEYKSFCENLKLSQKVMKYSTFTSFLKKQFPNVKFHKREEKKPERSAGKPDESERKTRDDQGVDKSTQVDKTSTYIPTKAHVVVDGERMDLYPEGGTSQTAYGPSDQSYDLTQPRTTHQYYPINGSV